MPSFASRQLAPTAHRIAAASVAPCVPFATKSVSFPRRRFTPRGREARPRGFHRSPAARLALLTRSREARFARNRSPRRAQSYAGRTAKMAGPFRSLPTIFAFIPAGPRLRMPSKARRLLDFAGMNPTGIRPSGPKGPAGRRSDGSPGKARRTPVLADWQPAARIASPVRSGPANPTAPFTLPTGYL